MVHTVHSLIAARSVAKQSTSSLASLQSAQTCDICIMHTSVLLTGPSGLAAASCPHAGPTASRASAAAPVCTQRQHNAPRQQSLQRGHHVRRTTGACSATDSSGQGPQDLYPNINRQHQAANGDYNGPQLVPLDVESSMGLGGTSEDIFGELVSSAPGCSLGVLGIVSQTEAWAVHAANLGTVWLRQAVLLVGFSRDQVATFRSMMDDMEV